jgi:hypothetical protein
LETFRFSSNHQLNAVKYQELASVNVFVFAARLATVLGADFIDKVKLPYLKFKGSMTTFKMKRRHQIKR